MISVYLLSKKLFEMKIVKIWSYLLYSKYTRKFIINDKNVGILGGRVQCLHMKVYIQYTNNFYYIL